MAEVLEEKVSTPVAAPAEKSGRRESKKEKKEKRTASANAGAAEVRALDAAARRERFLKGRVVVKKDHRVLQADAREEVTPYGLIALDYCAGLGGMPRRGRVIHIHGQEHSGKSTLGYTFLRNYQLQTQEPIAIMDHEQTLNNEYLEGIGLDTNLAEIYLPSTMRESARRTLELMKEGVRVFMFDSIPRMHLGVEDAAIISGEAFDASVGDHARAMKKFFDAMLPLAARYNATFIFINQIRSRIESSQEARSAAKYQTFWNLDYTLPGGKSVRYVTSVMLETKVRRAHKGDKDDTEWLLAPSDKDGPYQATEVAMRVLKNKVNGSGYRKATLYMRPNHGFDDWISVRELAREYKEIDYVGAKWVVGDPKSPIIVYNNKADAIQDLVVNENMAVLQPLRERVIQRIQEDGASWAEEVDQRTIDYMAGEKDDDEIFGTASDFETEEIG